MEQCCLSTKLWCSPSAKLNVGGRMKNRDGKSNWECRRGE